MQDSLATPQNDSGYYSERTAIVTLDEAKSPHNYEF
jgi:hypothetical protein